jgi:hypothetical protein
MSKDQQVTAVRVANVPQQEFDAAVEGDDPPTVTAPAEMGKQARPKPTKLPTPRQAMEMAKAEPGLCVPARDGRFHCIVSDEERQLGDAYMALRYDILGDLPPLDPALAARAVPPRFAADIARRAQERHRWLAEFIVDLEDRAGPPVRPRILAEFGDGKWHSLKTIAARIGEPEASVKQSLDLLADGQSQDVKCERKQVGTSWSYRLFPIHQDRAVGSLELAEKLGPIIGELLAEGRKRQELASPTAVARLAHQLKTLIDAWVR